MDIICKRMTILALTWVNFAGVWLTGIERPWSSHRVCNQVLACFPVDIPGGIFYCANE